MLAGAFWERTNDLEFIRSMWPALESALSWIDRDGDVDGDGFVEYQRQAPSGLLHQGWKDADDAVVHADGTIAEGPIALCEVQGYVYAARRAGAALAAALGMPERAASLLDQAEKLKLAFNRNFWSDELGTYAMALDGAILSPAHCRRGHPVRCFCCCRRVSAYTSRRECGKSSSIARCYPQV
jgi:glycogen debranching enzyme